MSLPSFMDRATQRAALQRLAVVYPAHIIAKREMAPFDVDNMDALFAYLEEHGLVKCVWSATLQGARLQSMKITASGLDFIADDGGLSSVLGVQTIKLHEESVRALISKAIDDLAATPVEKGLLRDALEKAPQEVIKTLTSEAIKSGLKYAPDAWTLLRGLIPG